MLAAVSCESPFFS